MEDMEEIDNSQEQSEENEPQTQHLNPHAPLPAPPTRAPSHWLDFDGCAVMVQLRTPMLLISYPNHVIEQDGELAKTDYLRGICSVRDPDLNRNITVVTQDPFRRGFEVVTLVPVSEITYISRVDTH